MHARQIPGLVVSAAAHALLLLALTSPALMRPPRVRPAPSPRTIAIVAVPTEDPDFPGLNPLAALDGEPPFARPHDPLPLGHFDIDTSKIADRARVLFPFLTPGLSLDLFPLRRADDPLRPLQNPLLSPEAEVEGHDEGSPLALDPRALQALIDRAWARRDRWHASQAIWALTGHYDPDRGDLPRVIREYGEQDMGQYYYDARRHVRDPRFWTELALAADHVDFIRVIRRYTAAHPSTRTTTELLFILDKIAEGSRNILETLRTTDPAFELDDTRTTSPDAYRLAEDLRAYYAGVLDRKGLSTPEAITAAYGRMRLEILDGILRTTPDGYRAGDARFLIGTIHWHLGQDRAAIAAWCRMSVGPDDVTGAAARALLAALGAAGCAGTDASQTLRHEIDGILDRQDRDWWDFQYGRLRQFGYAPDTFWRADGR